jgi:acetylornithine deacetylase
VTLDAILERLVATASVSGQEGPVADFVQGLLVDRGIAVQREGHNLWFEVGRGGPRLLVNSHLDTVPPCDGWSGAPWEPRWSDERLVGLGANDAKGCVAAMLWSAFELAASPVALAGTAVFAFTAEEETGGRGIQSVLDRLRPLDAAVVGEPTGLQVCTAQRGMLILRCVARGQSAHAAHASLGENAIHKAARDIARLELFRFEGHPLLGASRPQVTQVEGGLARNQVPDACEFFVDLRSTPNLDHEELARFFASQLESDVHIHSDRYLPMATESGEPIVQAALAAAGAAGPVGSATTSDWAWLGSLPTVKVGPGDTHRSHRPDEYLLRSELHKGAAFYSALIPAYFSAAKKKG